jgi:hypothetical protein
MLLSVERVSGAGLDRFFASRSGLMERRVVAMATVGRLFSLGATPVAAGGLVRVDDGRLFLFFDVEDAVVSGAAHAKTFIRTALEMLQEAGEPVWTPCHATKYPRAPKLVAMCGFMPTDEFIEDARVWLKLP